MLLMFYDFIVGISQNFEPNSCLALKMATKIAVTLRGYSVLSCMMSMEWIKMLSSLTALSSSSSSFYCYCHYLLRCF